MWTNFTKIAFIVCCAVAPMGATAQKLSRYLDARADCGPCMQKGDAAGMSTLKKVLIDEILVDIGDERIGPFLKSALKLAVYKDLAHIEASQNNQRLHLSKVAESLRTDIYDFWFQAKDFNDPSVTFQRFESDIKGIRGAFPLVVKRFFGIDDFSRASFDAGIWPKIRHETDSMRAEKEDLVYSKLVPIAKLVSLDTFLSKIAPYDVECTIYNARAQEAFLDYYHIFTADGETASIDNFLQHIKTKNRLWQILATQNSAAIKRDRGRADTWGRTVYGTSTVGDLLRTTKAAAPREIAFVALQKAITSNVKARNYAQAKDTVDAYLPFFRGDEALAAMALKPSALSQLLGHLNERAKEQDLLATPVPETRSKNQELSYVLNKKRTRLALIPPANGAIRRFEIRKNLEFVKRPDFKNALPETDFYVFKNMGGYPDSLESHEKAGHIAKDAGRIQDVCVSDDGNIRIFVCKPNNPLDHSFYTDAYPFPGFAAEITNFQEYYSDKPKGYHGKTPGNPNTDIYYAVRKDNIWLPPRRLGGNANTPFAERSPILSKDNGTLYFASEGHPGLGGFDIYRISISSGDNNSLEANGDPENIYEANSPMDDLFYTSLSDSTAFVSSNRSVYNDFDLYKIAVTAKKTPQPPPPPRPSQPPPPKPLWEQGVEDFEPILIDGELVGFDAKCREWLEADPDFPKGQIEISGRIYYKGALADSAVTTFYAKDGQKFPASNVGKGHYRVWVPYEKREFRVVAKVYPKEGGEIEGFTQDYLAVCDNASKKKYVEKNIRVNGIEIEGKTIAVPFFFKTDVYNTTICQEKLMRRYYEEVFEAFRNKKGT